MYYTTKKVAYYRSLDDAVLDVTFESLRIIPEIVTLGITADAGIIGKCNLKGFMTLRKRPMRKIIHFESAGEVFRYPLFDEDRGAGEQNDFQRESLRPILVPQAFDRLGPAWDFLNLVQDEGPLRG